MAKVFSDRDFDRVARVVRRVEGMTEGLKPAAILPEPYRSTTITFVNESSEEVPAFGVMAVTGAGWSDKIGPYITIEKPSSTAAKMYAVNGPVNVAEDAAGQCYLDGWVRVAFDDDNTPECGQLWGPNADQWTASLDGQQALLRIVDVTDSTNAVALARLLDDTRVYARIAFSQVYTAGGLGSTFSHNSPGSATSGYVAHGSLADALTILTPAAYDDPVLQFNRTGLWQITLFNACYYSAGISSAADTSETSDSGGDPPGHTHGYAKTALAEDTPFIYVAGKIWTRSSGGSWTGQRTARSYMWPFTSGLASIEGHTIMAVYVTDEETDVKIIYTPMVYGDDGTIDDDTLITLSSHAIFEWISPQTS